MENSNELKRNIKPFNGEKYSVWKFRIRALLSELDIIKVIDETEPEVKTAEWMKAERKAKGVIVDYLADSFLGFVKSDCSAKDILNNLDAIYERKSIASQLAIRKRLLSLKLQGDTTLVKHFTIFDDLIRDMLAAGAKVDETDKVAHLLLTLPNTYDGVITAIETLSDENISLAFVKTRLLDHEIKILNENRETSTKVLSAEVVGENSKNCSNSKFTRNYTMKTKFKKNYKFKFGKNGIKCHHCGKRGHIKRECYIYKRSIESRKNQKEKSAQAAQRSPDDTSSFAFMTGDVLYTNTTSNTIQFILDSGASDHLINRLDMAKDFKDLEMPIKISVAKTGTFISAIKKGNIPVVTDMGIAGVLEDVLYCPDVPYNLLSVSKMQKAGITVIFGKKGVKMVKDNKTIMQGKLVNNVVNVSFEVGINTLKAHSIQTSKSSYELWHQRLGHVGKQKFLELKNKEMIVDLEEIGQVIPNEKLCEACIKGKQAQLPFNKIKVKNYVKRPLFNIHSDVCGPITPSAIRNKNYFVLFLDEYTHYCVTYLLTHKSDVFSMFKDFVSKSEARFNLKVVNLYSDNGREYLSNEMKNYCVEKGISYHLTVPRTPQLNGISERMVRTITEKARAMLVGADLNKVFWGDAVLTATYLINITPTKALKQLKTPYEMWHSKKPQVKYLKVFGATVFVHNKTSKTKFDDKSWIGILVGYEPNGYRVWDVENEKYSVVRDIIVDETDFLVTRPRSEKGINCSNSSETDICDDKSKSVESQKSDIVKSDVCPGNSGNKTDVSDNVSKSVESLRPDSGKSDLKGSEYSESIADIRELNSKSVRGSDNLGNCKLDSLKSKNSVNDNVSINNDNSSHGSKRNLCELRRSDRIKSKPPVDYNIENMENEYIMCAQSILCKIPTSYKEIKSRDDKDKWENAITEELDSLVKNDTWTLVDRPVNKNIVDCKWVFTIKNDEFGNPMRYKARLVAKGFSQEYLVDYTETFAPVARISSFRFIVAFANQHNLLLHHMDVKTAFLNGKLKELIFMKVPEGIKCEKNKVCKLNKALYGLKQAARCWFEEFENTLKEIGFQNSPVDRCIYILDRNDILKNIYVVLYVDDLVIVTANSDTMESFKNYLMHKFSMVDLKDIKLFLGIKITRINDEITLDQSAYVKTVLNKFRMIDCNSVNTPMESKLDYEALNVDEKCNAPCRNVIGCLMYLMICTRPDLSFSVNLLSRYMNKNNQELWKCLKRVLRYLKGTIDIKLKYKRNNYINILVGFVDSDWGGNENDRKSTTGYLFKLFDNCTICWNTKRQLSVAASSTEAEYMALFEAVREALWLKSLISSIKFNLQGPIIIYEDNNGCISIANNPTSHKRSKHIDVKYHFSREQVEKNIIKLNYIPTGHQMADMLTKSLPATKFTEFRAGMGLE